MTSIFTRIFPILAVLTAPIFAYAQTEPESTDTTPPPADSSDGTGGEARSIPLLNAEQLDELLGPIALYPDALIALILPAATMPTDLVLASRYLGAGGDTAKVDEQPWDETVRSLSHYPDVVKWMDDKLSWSIMVGDAFIAQPVDVMQSIQRLRTKARAAGTLADSDQQKVVEEEGTIRIVPAQPEVIYVPYYDPQVVYVSRPAPYWGWSASVITYPWVYPTGIWLSYDCDWYHHRVWVVNHSWRHHWYNDRVWWRPAPRRHDRDDHRRDGGFGHAWMPRHDRRHPDIHARREVPNFPHLGGSNYRGNDRRPDGDRTVDRRRSDGRPSSGGNVPPRFNRPDRDTAGPRGGATPRVSRPEGPGRSPANPPPVVRTPPPSRSVPPAAGRTIDKRGNVTVVSPGAPAAPRTGRWIDRAAAPAASARPSSPGPAPRVSQPSPRPAPRVAPPAPRVSPRPAPAPQRSPSQVVRVPAPGGGSRNVTVHANPTPERAPRPAAAPRQESRPAPSRSAAQTRVESRRSRDN